MSSVKDLKQGNVKNIVLVLIVGGLGWYLAINLSNAVDTTVNSYIPNQENQILADWISFGIAVVITIIALYIMFKFIKVDD